MRLQPRIVSRSHLAHVEAGERNSGSDKVAAWRCNAPACAGIKCQAEERLLFVEVKHPDVHLKAWHERKPRRRCEALRQRFPDHVVEAKDRDGPVANDRPLHPAKVIDKRFAEQCGNEAQVLP